MKFSFHLPVDRVKQADEFVTFPALREMAQALEAAGIDACYVTDHPAPADTWLASGGHQSLDPFTALAFVAAVTERIRVHTNIIVLPYRSPFITAKAAATLDVMSGGRLILGVGAGYLKEEFEALGAPFEERGRVMDEALAVIKAAWTGDSVTFEGKHFNATGNTALPRPVQRPNPPIWVGGNTDQAIARAVKFCDGWSPFPVSGGFSARVRTAEIATVADLKAKIDFMKGLCAEAGRPPLDVCMVPFGSTMSAKERPEASALIDHLGELREAGVTWSSIAMPSRTRSEYIANAQWFAAEVAKRV